MNELSEKEVIAWLRAKAAALNASADMLEGKPPQAAPKPKISGGHRPAVADELTMDELVRSVKDGKAGRSGDHAMRLSATVEQVVDLINRVDSPVVIDSRGWLKLREVQE